jgi:hypothetical protein
VPMPWHEYVARSTWTAITDGYAGYASEYYPHDGVLYANAQAGAVLARVIDAAITAATWGLLLVAIIAVTTVVSALIDR